MNSYRDTYISSKLNIAGHISTIIIGIMF